MKQTNEIADPTWEHIYDRDAEIERLEAENERLRKYAGETMKKNEPQIKIEPPGMWKKWDTVKWNYQEILFLQKRADDQVEIIKALFEVVHYLATQQGKESTLAVEQHLDELKGKLEGLIDEQD